MGFRLTEQHRSDYNTSGVTILRGIVPVSLIDRLRTEAEHARTIARQNHGPQAQRLQPIPSYPELHPAPFEEFLALPDLLETVSQILGSGYSPSKRLALFFEPENDAWCMPWHRDWGNVPGIDLAEFYRTSADLRMYNQINAPLYDDHSLWLVPGSHNRRNTHVEEERFAPMPAPGPGLSSEMLPSERERTCLEYLQTMPGAVNIQLHAGDIAFYRACQWHTGYYLPYVRRATLHDAFLNDADRKWQAYVRSVQSGRHTPDTPATITY